MFIAVIACQQRMHFMVVSPSHDAPLLTARVGIESD